MNNTKAIFVAAGVALVIAVVLMMRRRAAAQPLAPSLAAARDRNDANEMTITFDDITRHEAEVLAAGQNARTTLEAWVARGYR